MGELYIRYFRHCAYMAYDEKLAYEVLNVAYEFN